MIFDHIRCPDFETLMIEGKTISSKNLYERPHKLFGIAVRNVRAEYKDRKRLSVNPYNIFLQELAGRNDKEIIKNAAKR